MEGWRRLSVKTKPAPRRSSEAGGALKLQSLGRPLNSSELEGRTLRARDLPGLWQARCPGRGRGDGPTARRRPPAPSPAPRTHRACSTRGPSREASRAPGETVARRRRRTPAAEGKWSSWVGTLCPLPKPALPWVPPSHSNWGHHRRKVPRSWKGCFLGLNLRSDNVCVCGGVMGKGEGN